MIVSALFSVMWFAGSNVAKGEIYPGCQTECVNGCLGYYTISWCMAQYANNDYATQLCQECMAINGNLPDSVCQPVCGPVIAGLGYCMQQMAPVYYEYCSQGCASSCNNP